MLKPHWTPRYLCDRAAMYVYEWTHPQAPWLTPKANAILSRELQPQWRGVEWGAGRSTVWLSTRVAHLTSIEHDFAWHAQVREKLSRQHTHHASLHRVGTDLENYLAPATALDDASLDFALVDGIHRAECVQVAIQKLRPGGMLIVDNIERYVPHTTRSPEAIGPDADPISPEWERAWATISIWPHRWTSSGVTDTAIFTKP